MIVRFLVNNIFNGWMPDDTRLGGTEESVVEWAERLAKEYKVQVFSNFMAKEPFIYRGAVYFPRNQYLEQVGKEQGITVNIKSYDIPVIEPSAYLTNEVDAYKHDLSDFAFCIFPSKWAVDNISVNTETEIVPHGYDPESIYPGFKTNKQCLYTSSPDRGLDTLELIWPSIVANHPDAQLIVTYGGSLNTPNTTLLGEVSEQAMNRLYQTSDIWLHPCNGGELFGISAVKAQAAEAIPVYFPTMALSETVQIGVPCMDARDMFDKLNNLLDDKEQKRLLRKRLAKLKLPTWDISTALLEQAIMKLR